MSSHRIFLIYPPASPEDSAGWLYSRLQADGARLIEEQEHYYAPLQNRIVYQLWQTPDGEFTIREANYYETRDKPSEEELSATSIEDYREYVHAEIDYYRWLATPEGQSEQQRAETRRKEREARGGLS